jgi:hypothetical protein
MTNTREQTKTDARAPRRRVYVASSWRNEHRQQALRRAGHTPYDFRNPAPGDHGFSWRQVIDDEAQLRDPRRFRYEVLTHPIARAAFEKDMTVLREASVTVLVLPCGRSAHLELGLLGLAHRIVEKHDRLFPLTNGGGTMAEKKRVRDALKGQHEGKKDAFLLDPDSTIPRSFIRMTPLDKAGRRALWAHYSPFDGTFQGATFVDADGQLLEMRAGREGGDIAVTLRAGEIITPRLIQQLVDLLLTVKFGLECYEPGLSYDSLKASSEDEEKTHP